MIILLVFCFLFFAIPVSALRGNWNLYSTDYYDIYYPSGYENYVEEMVYYLEEYREDILEVTGNSGDLKPNIVVQDMGVLSNGFANAGEIKITNFTSTPEPYLSINSFESWPGSLVLHEYTHLAQMNNSSNFLSWFGNIYSPNIFTPLWFKEGIAIYGESMPGEYGGRSDDGYYDALIGDKIAGDNIPDLNEMTYRHDNYFYGSRFVDYLIEEYGEDSFGQFIRLMGSGFSPGFEATAKVIYNRGFEELYDDWKHYERERYKPEDVNRDLLVETEGQGEIYDFAVGGDRIYYLEHEVMNPGPLRNQFVFSLKSCDLSGGNSEVIKEFNYYPHGIQYVDGELYFGSRNVQRGKDELVENSGFEYMAGLYRYDISDGEIELLFSDKFKDFAVVEDKIYYVKEMPDRGSEFWSFVDGEKERLGRSERLFAELEPADDGLFASGKLRGGSWGIYSLEPENLNYEILLESPQREMFLKNGENGLYYTANYGGEYAVYRYENNGGNVTRLSNDDYASGGLVYGNFLYYMGLDDGRAVLAAEVEERSFTVPEAEEPIDFGVDLREGQVDNPGTHNYSKLLSPDVRFPAIVGTDVIGYNQYSLFYFGYLDFSFRSRLLQPLIFDFSFNSLSDEYRGENVNLSLNYPVYRSMSPGISGIDLGISSNLSSSYVNTYFEFAFPRQRAGADLRGNIDDLTFAGNLRYDYYLSDSSFRLEGDIYPRDDRPNWQRLARIDFDGDDDYWYRFSMDYVHKLFEINGGFWWPNFFIGDIYGSVFGEGARSGEVENYSLGYELNIESGAFYGMSDFAISPGVYYSSQRGIDGPQFYLSIKSGF